MRGGLAIGTIAADGVKFTAMNGCRLARAWRSDMKQLRCPSCLKRNYDK